MDFETFISSYGYIAVFLGIFLEGETILLLAGFLAYRGHLSLPLVGAVALAAALMWDQIFFHIGRTHGTAFLAKHPRLLAKMSYVRALITRHQTLLSIGFRFLIGLRTVSPVALGLSAVAPRHFFICDLIGVTVWVTAFACLGYFCAQTLAVLEADLRRYEWPIALTLAGVSILVVLARLLVTRRRAARITTPT